MSLIHNVASRAARRVGERSGRELSLNAGKTFEHAAKQSLGRDTFMRTAAKTNEALDQLIKNPKVLRQINSSQQRLTLQNMDKLVHDPALLPTSTEVHTFERALSHRSAAETEALKKLVPDEQATYRQLHQLMGDRPDGRYALQNLLLDGKLTVASTTDPQRNLIKALGDLSKQDLAPGIDRKELVAQVHQEIADPIAISQEGKGTCAATGNGQVLLAMKAPTNYVDVVGGLASPKGEAKLPSGLIITRKPDWRAGNDRSTADHFVPGKPENQGRTISSELIQPSFMQVGMGKTAWYSNTLDAGMAPENPAKQVNDGGLSGEQTARLMQNLFPNQSFSVLYPTKRDLEQSFKDIPASDWGGKREAMSKAKMLKFLESHATPDTPVAVGVNYQNAGGHAILVTGLAEKPKSHLPHEKAEWVEYINPWGRLEQQRADAFMATVTDMEPSDAVKGVMVG